MVNDPNIIENEAKILEKITVLFTQTGDKKSDFEEIILSNLIALFAEKGEASEENVKNMLLSEYPLICARALKFYEEENIKSPGAFSSESIESKKTQCSDYTENDVPEITKILEAITLDETRGNPNITANEAVLYHRIKKWSNTRNMGESESDSSQKKALFRELTKLIEKEDELSKEAAKTYILKGFPNLLDQLMEDYKKDNTVTDNEFSQHLAQLADYQATKVPALVNIINKSGLRER